MANNINGATTYKCTRVKTPKECMELYDALPKEYRDVLKESVMNLTATNPKNICRVYPTAKSMRDWIRQKDILGTRDTYGRSHPEVAYK